MQLGSSLRRQRGGRDSTASDASDAFSSGAWRRLATALALALLAFAGGWLISTRLLFPAPPPPGDLYEVPDLYGLTVDEALDRIRESGLAVGSVGAFRHPERDSGSVVGQSPLPGQLSVPGDSVRVTLSLGVERTPMPDVGQLSVARALSVLEAAGFSVTVDSVESNEPLGQVVAQDPAAEASAISYGEVRVSVSLGPPLVRVPLMVGMQEEAARDTLEALGLRLSGVEEVFRFGGDQGSVVEQEPPAGALVDPGSEIRLVVGRRRRGGRSAAVRDPRVVGSLYGPSGRRLPASGGEQ